MAWLPWRQTSEPAAGLGVGNLDNGRRKPRQWWIGAQQRALGAGKIHQQTKKTARGGGQRKGGNFTRTYSRRSVVKVSYRRASGASRKGKAGGWVKHAKYLSRERAQIENGPGLGFDAKREGIDIPGIVQEWEKGGDRLMWSLIISPQDAEQMDLQRHVRDFVTRMQQDLGTELEWVGIDHNNTDDKHVHLLIRGVRDDGQDLLLDREYISKGLRDISQDLAERELGPQTEQDYLIGRGRGIGKNYWTELDRALERRAGDDRVINYSTTPTYSPAGELRIQQEKERLAHLEQLHLAKYLGGESWELSGDHEKKLRTLQQEHDILKTQARARKQEQQRSQEREI
jgi:type IV secretory pathway VirD2 relaxase